MFTGINGSLPWLEEPFDEEASARGGVGALLSSAGGEVGALSPSSATLLGGGVLTASSSLVAVLAPVLLGSFRHSHNRGLFLGLLLGGLLLTVLKYQI